jgi:hypothetical protein
LRRYLQHDILTPRAIFARGSFVKTLCAALRRDHFTGFHRLYNFNPDFDAVGTARQDKVGTILQIIPNNCKFDRALKTNRLDEHPDRRFFLPSVRHGLDMKLDLAPESDFCGLLAGDEQAVQFNPPRYPS